MGLIYLIHNHANGSQYVGQTISCLSHRWAQHKSSARTGSEQVICRAIRKYGEDSFTVQLLCSVDDDAELDEYEETFIELYNTLVPKGYNVRLGGNQSRAASAKSRSRQLDADLPLYITHFTDYTANTEGYRVRHTPSGQKATVSTPYLTMPQKLELALKFLEKAKVGTASKTWRSMDATRVQPYASPYFRSR